MKMAQRRLIARRALLIATLLFDLWMTDSAYGVRRCRHRFEGRPEMRDGVIVCISVTGAKSLRNAGLLGRLIADSRGPSYP
jgi:hypothetical protein